MSRSAFAWTPIWTKPITGISVQTYQSHRDKGWGVIAKALGIKPGSRAFHALKRGNLVFDGVPAEDRPKGKGKGKGSGK